MNPNDLFLNRNEIRIDKKLNNAVMANTKPRYALGFSSMLKLCRDIIKKNIDENSPAGSDIIDQIIKKIRPTGIPKMPSILPNPVDIPWDIKLPM